MAVTRFCVSQASSLSLRRLVRLSHSIVLYESTGKVEKLEIAPSVPWAQRMIQFQLALVALAF